MANELNLYIDFVFILTYQSTGATFIPKGTHIHTPMGSSAGKLGLSTLPRGTPTCVRQKLESNLQSSNYKPTTLPSKPQSPWLTPKPYYDIRTLKDIFVVI